jgi:hypothetical protein
MTPEELGAAIDARDAVAVTRLLLAASEPERIRCANLARERLDSLLDAEAEQRAAAMAPYRVSDTERRGFRFLRDLDGTHAALGLAVLGTARSARQGVSVLDMIDVDKVESQAAAVLTQRPRPWLDEFCERAFSASSWIPATGFDPRWRLTRALVRAGVADKPRSGWYIRLLPRALEGGSVRDALLADPALLGDEIFDLFTVDDAGGVLRTRDEYHDYPGWNPDGRAHPERTWRVTLAQLAAEGHIDRDRLLDSCLGAFFCDFRPSQLTWYVRFHAELAPGVDELAARRGSYLRLLAADAGTAVGLGQSAITALLKAGRIDPAEVVEASGPALARPEKKYAAAQLRLLDAIASQHPDLAGNAAEAVASGFEHPRTEIQEQALALAARHGLRAGAAVRERLRAAASLLAPSLQHRAQALLGISDAGAASNGGAAPETLRTTSGTAHPAAAGDECAERPPPAALAVMPAGPAVPAAPPRVASLAELVAAAQGLAADPWDPLLVEQVIDGIARFAADRAAFTAALAPLARYLESGAEGTSAPPLRTLRWILHSTGWAGGRLADLSNSTMPGPYMFRRPGWRPAGPTPRALLGHRLWEVWIRTTRTYSREARPLLAHPDTAAGHVDPGRVVAEVAAIERAGAEPWPADLTQTLLRLPRSGDERVTAEAARLGSPAGRALADVLRRGAWPDPLTEFRRDSEQGTGPQEPQSQLRNPFLAKARQPAVPPVTLHVDPAAPVANELLGSMWELTRFDDDSWPSRELLVWAHALPSHREVAAAHALQVMSSVDSDLGWLRPDGRFVAGLPDMQGPVGPAVTLTLACCLSAHDPAHRAAAVEALTAFARHGAGAGEGALDGVPGSSNLSGAALGQMLAEMSTTKVARVAECLRSAAADPGTRPLAWHIASAAIPGLLGSGARDAHLLLSVAADLAAQLGVRAHIDGLAEAAATKGSSRLAVEARRLRALL